MIRYRSSLVAAAALAVLASPAAAQGRTAMQILHDAATRSRAASEGVQNYTVQLKAMGQSLVNYVSRDESGAFRTQSGGVGPMAASLTEMTGCADELLVMMQSTPDNEVMDEGATLSYDGVSSTSGAPAHVVTVRFAAGAGAASGQRAPRRMSFHLDTATLVTRRLEMDMAGESGASRNMLVQFDDWHPMMGMQLPYRRHVVAHGLRADVLGPDTANAAQRIERGRAMLASVPEDQREGVRQMLAMLDGLVKRDELVVDEIVTAVAVNQGPPPGITLSRCGNGN